ncbi:MAG: CpaF family protein [Candidatus Micrarchaeota archaeon]|nr:CpaF family protein [Candidatus Micrarchaeota archaeon]
MDQQRDEGKRTLAEYSLNANGMQVDIQIYESTEFVPTYQVTFPGISTATKLLLLSLRPDLISMVPIDPSRLQNSDYLQETNAKYIDASNILIDKVLPGTSQQTKVLLTAYIINMMLGYGDLEVPLADEMLEEIAVNGSKEPVWVFHKMYGWCKTNIKPASEEQIYDVSEHIGRRIGREINNLAPLMDAELPDGSRVNATLFPVSQVGNTITIRKFAKNPWTMPAMVKNNTISPQMAALVWLSIQSEVSILIAGGTASGKTSFLNSCSIFFPANRRVVSVEETRELTLPGFVQWVSMLSREPNPEGKGEVSLYNLMINALRQRPDIVVIGEVRVQKDAETLFEAIHTGHAVYGTLHADNVQDVITRMTNPPINVPKIMMNAIGGIVVNFRHRTRNIRRVLEFGEVVRSGDANAIYRWNSATDAFMQIGEMTRMADTISLYSGMTRKEIFENVEEKTKILDWMVKNNVLDVDNAGLVVANYYKHRDKVVQIVNDNVPYSKGMF